MAIVDHWNSSLSVICITVAFLAIVFIISSILSPLDQDVTNMLKQNGLSRKSYENMLLVAGLPDDKDVAEINIEEVQEALGSISYKYEDILLAISSYQDTILLQLFFEKYEVPNIVSNRLKSKHITTLSHLEMAAKDKDFLPDLFSPSEKEYQESLNISLKYIPKTFKRKSKLLKQYSLSRKPGFLWKFFYKTVLIGLQKDLNVGLYKFLTILIGAVIILVIFVMECISRLSGLRRFGSGSPTATLSNFLSLLSRNRSAHVSNNVEFHVPPLNNQNNKLWLWDFFTGAYVHAQSCIVTWGWEDLQEVGGTVSFSIKLMQKNGKPFRITNSSSVFVEIKHKDVAVTFTKKPVECKDNNVLLVSFSVHKSGIYHIDVMVSGKHIKGSPFFKEFEAGPIDARQTGFSNYCSTIVCTAGVPYSLSIGTHDSFGNPTVYKPETNNYFKIRVTESESSMKYCPVTQLINQPEKKMLTMRITMSREGLYNASVSYGDVKLRNGDFNILVVSNEDMACVNKNMAKKNRNIWYEARLLSGNSEEKAKKVYVYVSPKQLTLKEYYLKIIGKKINTWRVCPSTKFYFNGHNSKYDLPVLTIHDCCQPPITIASKDRSIIAATFTNFLLRNIGGSETFLDKQTFFVQELRKSQKRGSHTIRIDRQNFLYSAFRQTKHYDAGDWYKVFEVMFLGEQGLDWGGLRREFFECICTHLFDPSNSGLFMRFSDDSQGLVHPNPKRKPEMKLKYYEFAGKIVGKCLFDSAMGSLYRQLVKARFSRSFLAQIIGLQVNYKYFETDDPELYKTKIKFIEDNNIDDMELTFSDEEYSPDGQLVKVVDLIPNGSNKMVTNENKQQYLNCLAQYRLATCVRDEVDAFMKGLNMLISDSLLSIFDENELELLMCGTGNYNISDFKANATLERSPAHSSKVLEWFWTIVGSFTEEQMARLLQFTTGCSQLPAGGFAELNPKFHISFTPNFNTLPMAHTCFNQLCLPDYDSLESFHRLLLIAINEGSQGFGLV